MKTTKTLPAILLTVILALGLAFPTLAAGNEELRTNVAGTAAYMYKTVANPQVGSIGGEWAVLGLARSGYTVPVTYYQSYYATVEAYVTACKGVLDERKYTEYSRVALTLASIGKDPTNVAGYNLLTPLGDYGKTIWQGLNGPIWALIALDSGGYVMPKNPEAKTQATRQMYVDRILSCQLKNGGWSLAGTGGGTEMADPDITGMALQALAKYTSDTGVRTAVDKALGCLSNLQNSDGGFTWGGDANSESVVQVLVGLCELGVSLDDARFVKNGHSLLDNLLTYRQSNGSFRHTASGSGSNQMATEQGFYGIVAALRVQEGKNSLYRMSDAITVGSSASVEKGKGLAGKNADVKAVPITAPGTTFLDVVYSDAITAIEALASRGILTGKGDGTFAPDGSMTRAEFAAAAVRALGLTPKANEVFSDVSPDQWYAPYAGAANTYGIVTGKTATTFDPTGTITRQEAAVMVARAAKLCGLNTAVSASAIRDILAQFEDYVTVADWAMEAMAFCYDRGILDQSALEIQPTVAITRGEVARMLFNMLGKANLL